MSKNRRYLLLVLIIVAVCALTLSACAQKDPDGLLKLDVPQNVTVSGNSVTWSSVANAKKYYVEIARGDWSEEYAATSTVYNIDVDELGTYAVRVRAYGDGEKYGSSDFSEAVTYVKKTSLAMPTVRLEGKLASWDAVEHAVGYTATVTDKDGNQLDTVSGTETSYSFDQEKYAAVGAYTLKVFAYAAEDDAVYGQSDTATVKYLVTEQLKVPEFSAPTSASVTWSSVKNATAYLLTMTAPDGSTKEYRTSATSYSKSSIDFSAAGKYYAQVQALGDGEVYLDSAVSDRSEEQTFVKLEALNDSRVALSAEADGRMKLTVDYGDGTSIENINKFVLSFKTQKADGTSALTALTHEIEVKNADGVYTTHYEYYLDDTFFKKSSEGAETIEYLLDSDYYGKYFELSVQATAVSNKIIASDILQLDGEYQSYKTPIFNADDGCYEIAEAGELAYVALKPDANYRLTANIAYRGYLFRPVASFTGHFYGNDKVISDLVLDGMTDGNVGMFARVEKDASVSDLCLTGVAVKTEMGKIALGALAAYNYGTITDCYVTGGFKANQYNKATDYEKTAIQTAGGAVAYNYGLIENTMAQVDVEATVAGGLVARNDREDTVAGTVLNSGALGAITALLGEKAVAEDNTQVLAGGLVAYNEGIIAGSFARGNVAATGAEKGKVGAGGCVAVNAPQGTISSAYAGAPFSKDVPKRGTVKAGGNQGNAGGFVGANYGTIYNASATASAEGSARSGGFVGYNTGIIYIAFATGGTGVSGARGGFAAANEGGHVADAYYYSLVDHTDAAGAQKTDDPKKLTELLQAGMTTEVGGTDVSTVTLQFGTIAEATMPYLKSKIYVDSYALTIKANAQIAQVGKLILPDGSVVEIGAESTDEAAKLEVLGDAGKKGTVLARYFYGNITQTVLVTVK